MGKSELASYQMALIKGTISRHSLWSFSGSFSDKGHKLLLSNVRDSRKCSSRPTFLTNSFSSYLLTLAFVPILCFTPTLSLAFPSPLLCLFEVLLYDIVFSEFEQNTWLDFDNGCAFWMDTSVASGPPKARGQRPLQWNAGDPLTVQAWKYWDWDLGALDSYCLYTMSLSVNFSTVCSLGMKRRGLELIAKE
ncbi:hypothetical protein P7K49_020849 [Saguinus oedipus]|uniref:Uncharacterized protein n=1 Tax=Saguinus oedipus TaxID=9490 RepID=A0ABQ9URQ0_SAGOE|nr:hypothetical protein P7K49_020849 [Saguinus oedipus]